MGTYTDRATTPTPIVIPLMFQLAKDMKSAIPHTYSVISSISADHLFVEQPQGINFLVSAAIPHQLSGFFFGQALLVAQEEGEELIAFNGPEEV